MTSSERLFFLRALANEYVMKLLVYLNVKAAHLERKARLPQYLGKVPRCLLERILPRSCSCARDQARSHSQGVDGLVLGGTYFMLLLCFSCVYILKEWMCLGLVARGLCGGLLVRGAGPALRDATMHGSKGGIHASAVAAAAAAATASVQHVVPAGEVSRRLAHGRKLMQNVNASS